MEIWLVRANCGDYYCGCGGGHVVGIATSKEDAERIQEEAKKATFTYTTRVYPKRSKLPRHLQKAKLQDVQRPVWEAVFINDPTEAGVYIEKP